jgi:hypothetical protein
MLTFDQDMLSLNKIMDCHLNIVTFDIWIQFFQTISSYLNKVYLTPYFHYLFFTLALGFPIESGVTKKLFPRSLSLTFSPSTTVNFLIAGNTKFFKVSVPLGVAPNSSTFELLRSFWP